MWRRLRPDWLFRLINRFDVTSAWDAEGLRLFFRNRMTESDNTPHQVFLFKGQTVVTSLDGNRRTSSRHCWTLCVPPFESHHLESMELTNAGADNDNNSDSGISPNGSDTEVLIYDGEWKIRAREGRQYVVHHVESSFRQRRARATAASDGDDEEKWYIIGSQVFLPFMIAGFGMVAAGLVLENVKVFHTSHFRHPYHTIVTKKTCIWEEIYVSFAFRKWMSSEKSRRFIFWYLPFLVWKEISKWH